MLKRIDIGASQIIIHTEGAVCKTTHDLINSEAFSIMLSLYIDKLKAHDSPLVDDTGLDIRNHDDKILLLHFLRELDEAPIEKVAAQQPGAARFLSASHTLHRFVEGMYDHWRSFDRFMVCHSEQGDESYDRRPYRTFNATIEQLNHLVRSLYRDICENITGNRPRIYRQVAAGCDVGLIAVEKDWNGPSRYNDMLKGIHVIRQVLINPPLIMDPPINTRTGQFQKVDRNPFDGMDLDKSSWLCYPAQVGPLVVFVYFHQRFMGLGCALANLFELATDEQVAGGPDAIYLFGAPSAHLARFGNLPTIFFDDSANGIMLAAAPEEDRFGYFGYLKKMILTLHNIIMMKKSVMPYHGSMTHIELRNRTSAGILLLGDTATGKSELLEAFRTLGRNEIRNMRIIADDMGSVDVDTDGAIIARGTEIGAFVRLDDLQQGFAFAQVDRAIFMSPQKVNARVVVPVTSLTDILSGAKVDFLLYANNYEQVDDSHPVIERFETAEHAFAVFSRGEAMAKGTTTSTGLVHSYFANIFGPPQYEEIHDALARRIFDTAFANGIFVGQVRTRLAIDGYESDGPREAASALFNIIRGK